MLDQVHTGTIFEVFRVRVGDELYAVKSPRPERPDRTTSWFPSAFGEDWFRAQHPSALAWELPLDTGCWSESVFINSISGDPDFYRGGFDALAWAGARTGLSQWTPHPRSVLTDPELLR